MTPRTITFSTQGIPFLTVRPSAYPRLYPVIAALLRDLALEGIDVEMTESELAVSAGSAAGEPRVKTLLRSMLAALDRDDYDTYWVTFEMLLSLHEEIIEQ